MWVGCEESKVEVEARRCENKEEGNRRKWMQLTGTVDSKGIIV
jgi:hypothetical protein